MSKSAQKVAVTRSKPVSAKTPRAIQPVANKKPQVDKKVLPVRNGKLPSKPKPNPLNAARRRSTARPSVDKKLITPPRAPKKVSRKSGFINAGSVAALILEDLSRNYSDVCNYTPEVELAKNGQFFLALESIKEKHAGSVDISPRQVWVKAQAEASLKKLVDSDFDRWPDTKASWFRDERTCQRTNRKINAWLSRARKGHVLKDVLFLKEIQRARAYIEWVIGTEVPLEAIASSGRHGPGSSVDVRGKAVHYLAKSGSLSCTSLAVDLACHSLSYDKGMWEKLGFDPTYAHLDSAREGFVRAAKAEVQWEIVNHDRLLFVHKSMTSLRSIGSQPTLNVMVQLGCDAVMKEMLCTRAGIDLSDQTLNQELARIGSRDWTNPETWCTLDKSSASNLIASELINLLFPAGWCRVLNRLRSPRYEAPKELGGGIHDYHMYAGMGNGTTFVVESLIFAAFAYATSDLIEPAQARNNRIFSVYGDDVIVRTSHAPRYIALAEYFGFRMNREKSFTEGPFRESCGADYYEGVNVRPAYVVSEDGNCHELDVIGTHNTLMDHPNWKLLDACKGIRALFVRYINEKLPTDHSGGLGFRPAPGLHGYSVVRKEGSATAHISPTWQRVLYYRYNVKAKLDHVVEVTPWLSLMTVLQKGTSIEEPGTGNHLALPYRKLVNIDLRPERDLIRSDLLRMLGNQLSRLVSHKAQPWFNESQGRVDDNL